MENNKSKKKTSLPIILAVVVIGILAYGITKYLHSQHFEDTDDAQIEGNINPVISRVSAYVREVKVEENQKVKKGDLIVILDDRDLEIKVEQSEAALENAKANVNVVKATTSSSQANVESAKANVENAKIRAGRTGQDFKRFERLIAQNSITQQQYDNAKADKESAETQLEVASKQLDAAQRQADAAVQQIAVAESNVQQKLADLNFAKLQLTYATLYAPVSGVISRKNVQPGQLVQAGQTLFSVVNDSDVWVVANFKETQLRKMKEGQHVDIEVDAFRDQKIEGEVYSFSGATGARFSLLPPDNATGNFVKIVQRVPVKIRIKKGSEIYKHLRPGMSVSVEIDVRNT